MLVEGENAICQCYPNRACFYLALMRVVFYKLYHFSRNLSNKT